MILVELAKISARIERCRIEMGMNQQEFAKYMGVTQGMVSKWESREYKRRGRKVCKLDSSMIMMGERLEKSAFRPLFIYNSYY